MAWRHSATQPTVHGSAQGVGNDCLGDELHIPLRQNQFRAQRLATPAPSRPLCQHCIILTLDHAGNRNTAIFSFNHATRCRNMKSSWLALKYLSLRINLSPDKNNIFTKFYDYDAFGGSNVSNEVSKSRKVRASGFCKYK